MSHKMNASRREFLRMSSMLSVVGATTAPFAINLATMASAAAQSAPTDYKALICLFMNGGNDHGNTVLATDSTSWTQYLSVRTTTDTGSIALPAVGAPGGVLPITPATTQAGRSFALHPNLVELKGLFDNGRAAIISNVAPLIVPTTLAQYKAASVPLPPKLFSHNDQQSLWQAYAPEGAAYGWGGRMGDLMAANNSNPIFTSISASGNAVFLAGKTVNQYQISSSGAVPIGGLSGALFGSTAGANPLKAIITADNPHLFQKEHAAVTNRSINAQRYLARQWRSRGQPACPTLPNIPTPIPACWRLIH